MKWLEETMVDVYIYDIYISQEVLLRESREMRQAREKFEVKISFCLFVF